MGEPTADLRGPRVLASGRDGRPVHRITSNPDRLPAAARRAIARYRQASDVAGVPGALLDALQDRRLPEDRP